MAVCGLPGHIGNRTIYRTRIVYKGDARFEGCVPCTDNLLTPLYSTQKREVVSAGTGKSFRISPAHVRHIRLRKLGSDGRTVYQNRRGNVT